MLIHRAVLVTALPLCLAWPVATHSLTLSEARARARAHNLDLRLAASRADASLARVRDAARGAPFRLSVSAENLGRDAAESTVEIARVVERGGDRRRRWEAADAQADAATAEIATHARDVLAAVDEACLAAWIADQHVALAETSARLAAETEDVVRMRHRAGATSRADVARAEAARAMAHAESEHRLAARAAAWSALHALWSDGDTTTGRIDLPAMPVRVAVSAESLDAALERHPLVALAEADVRVSRAQHALIRAQRTTDVDARVGVRHLAESGGVGAMVSVEIPLGQAGGLTGALAAAQHDERAAAQRSASARVQMRRIVHAAAARAEAARRRLDVLQGTSRPALASALSSVTDAYRTGRSAYLEVLDAQRAFLDVERSIAEATVDAWSAYLEYARTLGEIE